MVLADLDVATVLVCIHRARVAGIERTAPKTGEDRRVALCPALLVLKAQLPFRARQEVEGKIRHDYVFVQNGGARVVNL